MHSPNQKRHWIDQYKHLMFIALIIGLITFFFQASRSIDIHKNKQINQHINALILGNSKLSELLLKSRYQLLNNYDPLNQTHSYIEYHYRQLWPLLEGLETVKALDFKTIRSEEKNLFKDKTTLLERFLSHNAVLKNSRYYAEELISQTYQHLNQRPNQNNFIQIHQQLRKLEQLLITPTKINQQTTDINAPEIQQLLQSLDQYSLPTLKSLNKHAQKIIEVTDEIDQQLNKLIQTDYQYGVKLRDYYAAYISEREKTANIYTWLLMLLSIILLIYAIYSFQTIRTMIISLQNQQFALDQHAIVSITDPDGNIIYVNDLFIKISGYSQQELLGQNHRLIKSEQHPPAFFANLWQTISQGNVWHGEVKNKRKGGGYYWVNATIVPLYDATGKIFQYISIRTDITGQKNLEASLKKAKRSADAASQAKSDFIATMSHEIRTPMNGIMGMTELLLDTPLSAEQHENLEAVKYSADALMTILNDILDFSKMEAGKFDLHSHPFHLRQLCQGILTTLTAQAQRKGITLKLSIDDRLNESLIGDDARLRQILLNLMGNAVKFTEQGHCELKVTLASPNAAEASEQTMLFEVIDTGAGIALADQQNLFSEFTQVDSSSTRRHGGTGLGLAICRRLLNLMQSDIAIDSEPGKGSRFYFTLKLPVNTSIIAEQQPAVTASAEVKHASESILLVEDNEVNRKIATAVLTKMGYEVHHANNGQEALDRLKQQPFDAVLMDMQMPVMDGLEATRQWRAFENQYQLFPTPIIAMTANATAEDKQQCFEAGMNDFISKPFKAERLRKILTDSIPAA
ncbi:MAG: hypothetical protein COZ36_04850 [Piscirickettsiaceae bacterium CG_4_10_14_3_um_filter_44_349]|nr:response regulator [Thiomicrospira sp.]PIQ03548.1 MAG: hypothetical protein COW74_07075 [Piscirickettsiaceae bacterium CG18_big_fil_WC_8_21_14_2_50_44_103]PIU38068.1 MAG: hypothetical protein COT01_08490 [Piscirickettsiaceae bacterium CG07_land_8_20_14_0_80_44_28]PIW56639.1 MAG: hypothetical protein COW14_10305 [Piscirickettsiaceae bacterium CG12_big_fil_rev_8_21_14_0_65_44_934]PIW77252.1 MAG: hypothetical protein CO000_07935 [Piscirickettsiaceae bacterium CG_4_8_14_3_um_filter_44_38]PIX794